MCLINRFSLKIEDGPRSYRAIPKVTKMEVNENKKEQKNGINRTAILIALILGLSLVGYGYINISYKNRVFEAEQEEKSSEQIREANEESRNRRMLEACLADAGVSYTAYWNSNCKAQGLKEDCTLLSDLARDVGDYRDNLKEECFKKYPIK